jgi:hypothetical protein
LLGLVQRVRGLQETGQELGSADIATDKRMMCASIVNGDAIDGQNVKEQGRYLCEVDPEFQAEGAAILLQPLLQRVVPGGDGRQHIYVSRGSRYHAVDGASDEEFFAAMVHALRGPDGRHTRPRTHLTVDDVLFDVTHHQSVTIRYHSMPLEREIGFFLERCGRMRQEGPERVVIVRSHTHGSCRNYTERGFTFLRFLSSKRMHRPDCNGATDAPIYCAFPTTPARQMHPPRNPDPLWPAEP